MIRLPPSLLTLGPPDLVEFEERRQQRGWKKSPQHVSRFDIGDDVSGPNFCNSRKMRTNSDESSDEYKTFIHSPKARPNDSLTGSDGYEELQYPLSADLASEDQSSVRSNVTSAENASLVSPEVQPFSSPKDVFRYGDFDESQTPPHSLPFAPEEGSTPPNLPLNQAGLRPRTLPRSPLYFSHNAYSSPERRPTSSLTPHVDSSVATHNTPGIMFSRPARRSARFRHQTNSFSFDSSERSSAAYEQDRTASTSTTDTTPRPSQELRLHDELRGSSLTSSRVSSMGDVVFPSHHLSLPPPFSTTLRRASDALPSMTIPTRLYDSELSGISAFRHPETSPLGRSSDMSNHSLQDDDLIHARSRSSPSHSPSFDNSGIRTPSNTFGHSGSSSVNSTARLHSLLRTSVSRVVSYYRPPSPSRSAESPRAQSLRNRHPRTPRLAVYNDALPPYAQPQTSAQLPESRHQSRYHTAYTAPVARVNGVLGLGSNHGLPGQYHLPPTPSRPSRASRISPVGLQSAGFRGLYGGRENGDDEQSWVDGVRFSNAEVRLWGLRDAASDGRTLGDTPEREEWRIGRH